MGRGEQAVCLIPAKPGERNVRETAGKRSHTQLRLRTRDPLLLDVVRPGVALARPGCQTDRRRGDTGRRLKVTRFLHFIRRNRFCTL